MIGKKVGKLTVVRFVGIKPTKGGSVRLWECLCECGNVVIQATGDLNRGKAKSCGCSRYVFVSDSLKGDITGKRFGRLVALNRTERKNSSGAYHWKCRCDCGEYAEVAISSLNAGLTKSCGCLKIAMNMKRIERRIGRGGTYHSKRLNAENQKEARNFRRAVRLRDKDTCQSCGLSSAAGLCVHHIKSWSKHPELRYEVSNGLTLCRNCHIKIHSLEDFEIGSRLGDSHWCGLS